ncbi:hypothetical protein SVIOM342S_08198 [Streptomyces violaceorubidus]
MSATPAGPAATGLVCAFAVTRTPPDPAGLAAARGTRRAVRCAS